jgi:hypothetical protein
VPEIITRDGARAKGLKTFYTGTPCLHGHAGMRYVSSGCCAECTAIRATAMSKTLDGKAYRTTYRASPKGRAMRSADQAARRATEGRTTPPWQSFKELADIWEGRLPGHEVDHIHPLKGKISCGLNVPWNLQYLPQPVNGSKGNKRPPPGYFDWFNHHTNEPPRPAGPGEWAGWPDEYYDD